MSSRERNRLRVRAVAVSRAVKAVLAPGVTTVASLWRSVLTFTVWLMAGREAWRRHVYRTVFSADGFTLKRSGEIVLADLRDFCGVQRPGFSPDALVMARREGRREVFLRIANYLNLDEAAVQQLMEIDDGI